jgi:uncharacterized protein (DUF1330 family)
MAAYVIVDVDVTDQVRYDEYRQLSGASVAAYSGRFIVRGGTVEALEGTWLPTRLVVIAFASVDQAKRWYTSPEYTEARRVRQGAANFNMVVVEGV